MAVCVRADGTMNEVGTIHTCTQTTDARLSTAGSAHFHQDG